MYSNAHATVDDDTIRIAGFSSVCKFFAFVGRFFGTCTTRVCPL